MIVRTNHVAKLIVGDEISTSLFVRLYAEEGAQIPDEEFAARILIEYAKFRKCPLVTIKDSKEISPESYLDKVKNEHQFQPYYVVAKVAEGIYAEVYDMDEVDQATWRILRRHMGTEGTVEVRI